MRARNAVAERSDAFTRILKYTAIQLASARLVSLWERSDRSPRLAIGAASQPQALQPGTLGQLRPPLGTETQIGAGRPIHQHFTTN